MSIVIDYILKFKTFITNSLKYSSVAIVIIWPLAILFSYYGFIREAVIVIISEAVLYFALAEALINAILKKIKKEKVEFAKINAQIKVENFEALKEYEKEDAQFSDVVMEKLSGLLNAIITKKSSVDSEIKEKAEDILLSISEEISSIEEKNIPGHQISDR